LISKEKTRGKGRILRRRAFGQSPRNLSPERRCGHNLTYVRKSLFTKAAPSGERN